MSIALLIIDMQKEFIQDEKFKQSVVDSLEYINETADIFNSFDDGCGALRRVSG